VNTNIATEKFSIQTLSTVFLIF